MAGEKGWKAFIPAYNFIVWLKVIKKPWWWIFLIITPGINFLMVAIMYLLTAKSFNKRSFQDKTIALLFGYFYLPYLAFQKDTVYVGPEDQSKLKPSMAREWTEAIVFAVIAATVIRTFFFEAFTIPTSSLEKSMMVGDYLFVSKVSYGAKIPNTPLSFPFVHHTLPGTKATKSYLEWFKLPYFRLPGFGDVKNNDIVVFNYPDGDTVALNYQNQSYYQICRDNHVSSLYNKPDARIEVGEGMFQPIGDVVARPVDKRENYVKRCVAIAGDKLEIKNAEVYINDKHVVTPEHAQYHYFVKTIGFIFGEYDQQSRRTVPNVRILDKYDIYVDEMGVIGITGDTIDYLLNMPLSTVEQIKKIQNVISVVKEITPKGEYQERIFPHSPAIKWNNDNFGPFVIPKENATVNLDTTNIKLYNRIIENYELNKLEIKKDKIFINGIETKSYTFKMNYYFMMGDNRQNSADSRYWGVVPEDHIVGKPVFVWLSIKDPEKNPLSGSVGLVKSFTEDSKKGRFRWERFFCFVSTDGLSRSYLVHFIVIVLGIVAFVYFRKKRATKIVKK
ncbi:MAG: signal peptidase I [Bacteroidetes bacterium]|nr:signal peptidase I [Bacteroidota bacterium]